MPIRMTSQCQYSSHSSMLILKLTFYHLLPQCCHAKPISIPWKIGAICSFNQHLLILLPKRGYSQFSPVLFEKLISNDLLQSLVRVTEWSG